MELSSRFFLAFNYIFNPVSVVDYVLKIFFLNCLTTALALLAEVILGTEISNPIPTYFLIVAIIAVPFFTLMMIVTKRMNRLQEQLARAAETDQLTGLMNRRAFFSKVQDGSEGVVMMVDVDHFKKVNDTFGHMIGDDVLVRVAEHLQGAVRKQDLVARMGGEEFAIFLVEAEAAQADQVGQRISKGFTQQIEGHAAHSVTLSVGIATAREASRLVEVMKLADEALYHAKSNGRAQHVFRIAMPDPSSELSTG